MNLVIIGGVGAVKVGALVSKSYDDISVQVYKDTDVFLKEVLLRNMEIHRIMLMQDGVEFLDDDRVYNFVDYVYEHYPAIRLITVSKDSDINNFLGELINSPYSLHFKIEGTIKSKILLDIVSKDVPVLKSMYSGIIYKREASGVVDIVDEYKEDEISEQDNKGKRGFLSKVFGAGYKGGSKKVDETGKRAKIGQGMGVEDFSDSEDTDISFGVFDAEESDIGMGMDSREIFETIENEGNPNFKQDLGEWETDEIESEEADLDEDITEDITEDTVEGDFFEDEDDTSWVTNFGGDFEGFSSDIKSDDSFTISELEDFGETGSFDEAEEVDSELSDIEGIKSRKTFEDVKQEMENKEIIINRVDRPQKTKPQVNLEDIDDSGNIEVLNMDDLMQDYENSKIRVVERVVERVVTTHGGRQFRNKNGVRIIIVTGDRRVGVTKLSMNLSNLTAKEDKTLLVDLDRYRKGALTYLGVDDLIEEPEHIQNGLTHLKSERMLPNVSYLYPDSGFYCLLSMYGEEVTDTQIDEVQKILYNQTEYQTVIVDCPIENLYLLSDLLYVSTIMVCIEDDLVGITNSILSLNASVEDKYMRALYNNSMVVVARGSNVEKYKEHMSEVVNIFGLDETSYNWGSLEIIGTIKGTKGILKSIGM